jgi:hypothetical protein
MKEQMDVAERCTPVGFKETICCVGTWRERRFHQHQPRSATRINNIMQNILLMHSSYLRASCCD